MRRVTPLALMPLLALVACSDATDPSVRPGVPASLDATRGDAQTALPGNPLQDSLEVWVRDDQGLPLSGISVAWRVADGGGSASPVTSATNGAGRARTTWTLGVSEGVNRLEAGVDGLPSVGFTAMGAAPPGRAFDDRHDDFTGPQVHVLYVVPHGGVDRALDTNGVLAHSVSSLHAWFRAHSGGLSIRFDTDGGELDVGFVRLASSDAEIEEEGAFVVTRIEADLRAAGRLGPDKNYLVYYDGASRYACGGAAWPPRIPGRIAAMYLRGAPGGNPCPVEFATSPSQFPGYWEFAALHDLLHTFGVVSSRAPHHTPLYPGHVPEPNDLMYTGTANWVLDATTAIDVGRDDYVGPSLPAGVESIQVSPYVSAGGAIAVPAQAAPSAERLRTLRREAAQLPVHAPLSPVSGHN